LLLLYWTIGQKILERQAQSNWGDKVVKQLSIDLQQKIPNSKGFSYRNLQYMKRFAIEVSREAIVQVPLAQLSWYHHITLIEKVNDPTLRFWYAQKAVENGWSRDMMVVQLQNQLHERLGKAIHNFTTTLPSPQSDLMRQALKDPYIFDFLDLAEKAQEKDLEDGLIEHILQFLLELGKGFAFVGRQYPIIVDEEEYRIDLLFYHLKLHCYMAIDLKIGRFKPEYAGKMNFYLSALDDMVKTDIDNPSIGLILCKDKRNVTAEYALKDLSKPIGIAEFKLPHQMPLYLEKNLPSIQDLEAKLKSLE
jgi:predicted nuclease of restriction endonuclease-like (RecB) superfamily